MIPYIRIFAVFALLHAGMGIKAQAKASHMAEVDLELNLVDAKGRTSTVYSQTAIYGLDWAQSKCEIRLRGPFAYCNLDMTHDLISKNGTLLMKTVPTAHFTGQVVDALVYSLAQNDSKLRNVIKQVLLDTSAERSQGFDLPFYTHEESRPAQNGKTPIFNAYDGFVERSLEITNHALNGKKLVLKFNLHNMKAYGSAFTVVGSNDAGNFGGH